jgi:hypothetical protein
VLSQYVEVSYAADLLADRAGGIGSATERQKNTSATSSTSSGSPPPTATTGESWRYSPTCDSEKQ